MTKHEEIRKQLKNWVNSSINWSMPSPEDNTRFYKALSEIFSNIGLQISDDTFHEVIQELIYDTFPNLTNEAKDERANEFTIKFSYICHYLSCTQ